MLYALLVLGAFCSAQDPTSNSSLAPTTIPNSTHANNSVFNATVTPQAKTVATATTKHYNPQVLMTCVVIVVIFALLFDFSNGFHDTANSIATCVGTRSMYLPNWVAYLPFCKAAAVPGERRETLRAALTAFFAGLLNFLPVFAGELHVANQISSVIDTKHFPDGAFVPLGILCTYATLISALFWNFLTWEYGIPSSSSHGLIGSLVGSGLAVNGIPGVTWSKVLNIVYGLLGSPAYSGIVALLSVLIFIKFAFWAYTKIMGYEASKDNQLFRLLEVLSTGGLAWLHGANDAQKTMGIIAACLLSAGYTSTFSYLDKSGKTATDVQIDPWVMFSCHLAIGIGTLFGGWSIVGKMGLDIYPKMNRASGFAANTGAIVSLSVATYGLPIGLPVSTTHAMNCGILAAGVGESGFKAVEWKVMGQMVITWIITIPITMFLGFALASMMLIQEEGGVFFCIFWGLASIVFMIYVIWKQRSTRKETSSRVAEKYQLTSTPSFSTDRSHRGKETGVDPDPATVTLVTGEKPATQEMMSARVGGDP